MNVPYMFFDDSGQPRLCYWAGHGDDQWGTDADAFDSLTGGRGRAPTPMVIDDVRV